MGGQPRWSRCRPATACASTSSRLTNYADVRTASAVSTSAPACVIVTGVFAAVELRGIRLERPRKDVARLRTRAPHRPRTCP